jgi:hypothetical protein
MLNNSRMTNTLQLENRKKTQKWRLPMMAMELDKFSFLKSTHSGHNTSNLTGNGVLLFTRKFSVITLL